MRYTDAKSPREFLEHVLNEWERFCEVNTGIVRAISDLLNQTEGKPVDLPQAIKTKAFTVYVRNTSPFVEDEVYKINGANIFDRLREMLYDLTQNESVTITRD